MTENLKRVLIVDDEEDLTWTLSKKLSKDSDKFELFCVNSGREAIEILNQLPFDLVITDVRMPEVSGLELLMQIKELYPQTKVIIMTAYGSTDVHKAATDRGCFSYIEKPFEINELRQQILDAITRQKGFKGSVSDFQLSDLIQLNCLGRLTSALKINSEDDSGILYFQEGNITHAETTRLEGEAAFYYIMSWQGGEFQVIRNHTSNRDTINKGWQSLLLESLRRIDENSDLAKREAEREKKAREERLHQMLGKLYKSEGMEHVLLHSRAGFPLYYKGDLPDKSEVLGELGNHISNWLDALDSGAAFLDGDSLEHATFRFEKRIYVFRNIPGQDAYLSLVGRENVNPLALQAWLDKHLDDIVRLV